MCLYKNKIHPGWTKTNKSVMILTILVGQKEIDIISLTDVKTKKIKSTELKKLKTHLLKE